ncbi:MAG: iron-containing alcohol dehydrogenase [Pseudomonadota bacterium]
MTSANWSFPTSIRFGAGRIAELSDACKAAGMSRPLLVTDRVIVNLAMFNNALDHLSDGLEKPTIFTDVDSNPTDLNLDAGVEAFEAGDHDGVIAFGGGSALDLGKLIAFQAGQTRPVWDFEDIGDWWTRADADAIKPIIAVPTTAGTGSEVGRASVLTNTAEKVKKVIFHPKILPHTVIADPELTVGMPPQITAGTGMDALAHCLEAYCAPPYHPMCEGIAIEGMRLVMDNLPVVYEYGGDIEARGHMMSAAAMGATAFQKGLGAIHALSHPVGAIFNTHHGMTNAVVMPAVLTFNRPAIEPKIERLAAFLGIDGGFGGFFDTILGLREQLGVPEKLGALGVTTDRIEVMATMAPKDPTAGGNPVELTEEAAARLFADVI